MSQLIEYFSGDTVELKFDARKHTYLVDGRYVPSVTQVLDVINKPALMPWAAKEGAQFYMDNVEDGLDGKDMADGIRTAFRKKSHGARDIGLMVHKWCESAINWKLGNGAAPALPENDQAQSAIGGFRLWLQENDVEWLSAEEKVYHNKFNYAGTVDAVANINGEFCVVDFKTSTGIWDEYFLQTAAYAEAISLVYGEQVESAWILRFDKKSGKFESERSNDIGADFKAFLGAMELHGRLRGLREDRKQAKKEARNGANEES